MIKFNESFCYIDLIFRYLSFIIITYSINKWIKNQRYFDAKEGNNYSRKNSYEDYNSEFDNPPKFNKSQIQGREINEKYNEAWIHLIAK